MHQIYIGICLYPTLPSITYIRRPPWVVPLRQYYLSKFPSFYSRKRLAWALFVLLLSNLVCYQPTYLIIGFFLFQKFSNLPPPPHYIGVMWLRGAEEDSAKPLRTSGVSVTPGMLSFGMCLFGGLGAYHSFWGQFDCITMRSLFEFFSRVYILIVQTVESMWILEIA